MRNLCCMFVAALLLALSSPAAAHDEVRYTQSAARQEFATVRDLLEQGLMNEAAREMLSIAVHTSAQTDRAFRDQHDWALGDGQRALESCRFDEAAAAYYRAWTNNAASLRAVVGYMKAQRVVAGADPPGYYFRPSPSGQAVPCTDRDVESARARVQRSGPFLPGSRAQEGVLAAQQRKPHEVSFEDHVPVHGLIDQGLYHEATVQWLVIALRTVPKADPGQAFRDGMAEGMTAMAVGPCKPGYALLAFWQANHEDLSRDEPIIAAMDLAPILEGIAPLPSHCSREALELSRQELVSRGKNIPGSQRPKPSNPVGGNPGGTPQPAPPGGVLPGSPLLGLPLPVVLGAVSGVVFLGGLVVAFGRMRRPRTRVRSRVLRTPQEPLAPAQQEQGARFALMQAPEGSADPDTLRGTRSLLEGWLGVPINLMPYRDDPLSSQTHKGARLPVIYVSLGRTEGWWQHFECTGIAPGPSGGEVRRRLQFRLNVQALLDMGEDRRKEITCTAQAVAVLKLAGELTGRTGLLFWASEKEGELGDLARFEW